MKTPAKTTKASPKEMSSPEKKAATNPKKPNNDPDQTPVKETQDPPVANPNKGNQQNDPNKTKIGFNK